MAATLTETYCRRADLVFVVTLDYAGQAWRFSTRTLDTWTADGEPVHLGGGLDDLTYEHEVDLLADAPAMRSVSLDLLWPGDVAALIALGHDLASATGELAVIREGDDWEDRIVLFTGHASDPEYGGEGEPVALSLVEDSFEDTAQVPGPGMVVSDDTWTNYGESDDGAPYPIVFGRPGRYTRRNGLVWYTAGSPALWVETDPGVERVIVAGHPTQAGATGGTVTLYNDTFSEWVDCTASHTRDALGQLVTVADVSALADRVTDIDLDGAIDPWTSAHTLWAEWPTEYTLMCHDRAEPVKGAGDLIAWLLARSSVAVDWGRLAIVRDWLNRYEVSGFIDDPCAPLDWIASNLCPLLPISMQAGPDGVYPAVWRWDVTEADAVAHLVEGERVHRTGGIRYEGRDDVVNEVTLKFAHGNVSDTYKRRRTMTGDPTRVGEPDVISSLHAQESERRYGRRSESFETEIVYSTPTADLILTGLVMARGFARRVLTLDAGHELAWVRPWDVITYTADDVALSRQVARVRAVRWSPSALQLDVVVIEDPARDRRA